MDLSLTIALILLIFGITGVTRVVRAWKDPERSKVGRVTVQLPPQGLDDVVVQAMGATGFLFESERGTTTIFRQEALSAFSQRGLSGLLSQRLLMVTKTADGLVVVGPSGAIDKLLPFLGGSVSSKV